MMALPAVPAAMKLEQFSALTDELKGTEKMPALFIGHGSPMNAIEENPFTKSLKATGEAIIKKQKPNAILVVSAHWLTKGTYVNVHPKPKMIYDFGGFPEALSKVNYPALGSPEYAKEVMNLVGKVKASDDWGLDHGAWAILKHLFPAADIPVFQMSVDFYSQMDVHYYLGRMIRKLREKGVLVIGSGNVVHNLSVSMQQMAKGDPKPFDWAIEFDTWVKQKIEARDFQALIKYDKSGKEAKLAVPTMDHYAPMMYPLGMALEKEDITTIYEEVYYGGVSMRCFKVG